MMKRFFKWSSNSNAGSWQSFNQVNHGSDKNIGDSSGVTFDPATFSFIGGGSNNTIDSSGSPTSFATIGGGQNNYIAPGTNHASIFGGNGNQLSGNCSAILGGSGNNDNGVPNTGMYANGLTVPFAVPGAPSAFWVDQLVMSNIVVDTTGVIWPTLPTGTLYTTVAGPSVWGGRPIFVK